MKTSRNFYSQIHAYSNAFNQGWIRNNIISATRVVRDVDEDKSRLYTEILSLTSINNNENDSMMDNSFRLKRLQNNNPESIRAVCQDISPSGAFTISFRQGGKNDEIPLINVNGPKISHYLDASNYNQAFIGDSWFGGLSWSHDER